MKVAASLYRRGFTLLELLIVIAIIGILVAVSAASYSSAQTKSRNSRRMSDMKAIQNAAEQFYADNGYYPPSTSFGTTYLPAGFPDDPKPAQSYTYQEIPDNCVTTACVGYCVCAALEPATSTAGNSNADANVTCSGLGTAGAYFCSRNLQ